METPEIFHRRHSVSRDIYQWASKTLSIKHVQQNLRALSLIYEDVQKLYLLT